jgi:hypothetical protein
MISHRIVSLIASATEIVCALGFEDAAQHSLNEVAALEGGLKEKAAEFKQAGAEIYSKR